MTLCAKTEYACLALLELAAHFERQEPMRVRDICERHGIPNQFLVQILLQLKSAGLVTSIRGACGGYLLVKDPADISLCEVKNVIEGPTEISLNAGKPSAAGRALAQAWRKADAAQQAGLESMTIAELADQARGHVEPMYYI